jgi:taurine ABC transporter substrate-binding protein
VDVESYVYSFPFKRYDWTRTHARQPELHRYIEETAEEFGLLPHLRLKTGVDRAVWDDVRHVYRLSLSSGEETECHVLICATGFLNVPRIPDWPGLDTFRGPCFHTARWEHEHDLKGKRIAVPVGSTAHFSLMGALKHANIDENAVKIMSMSPDQIVAAWQQSAIDGAFVWPPAQTEILQTGKRLVGADEVAKWGYPTFNVWVVNTEFAKKNKKALIAFMKANDAAIEAYLKNPAAWTPDSAGVKAIAAQTGADPKQVPETLQGYTFLPLAEQLKPEWLGGGITKATKETAAFLKSAGRLDRVLDDYSKYVTDEYVKDAVR